MNQDRGLLEEALSLLEMWQEEREYKSVRTFIDRTRAYIAENECAQSEKTEFSRIRQ